MKAKLFEMKSRYDEYDDSKLSIGAGFNDWEEISEEDANIIENNLWRLRQKFNKDFVLIRYEDVSITQPLAYLKEILEKERIAAEQKKKKADEAHARKQFSKEAKEIEKKRKLFETLKKEFEDDQS